MTFEEWADERFMGSMEKVFAKYAWEAAQAAEREACAKVCDSASDDYSVGWDENGSRESKIASDAARDCAAAIRARLS